MIGSGKNTSIKYFAQKAFSLVGLDYKNFVRISSRKNKNKILIADISKAKKMFNFRIKTNIDELITIMLKNDLKIEKVMIKNSILLCTYNEGKYIKDTITSLYNFIPDLEIIIVDDSSSDETFSIINNLKKQYNLKIISRSQSKGLGSAFQRALIDLQGENVGWIDTNMGELAKMFPNMISELKNYDLILLSRYVKGGSDKRIFLRVFL